MSIAVGGRRQDHVAAGAVPVVAARVVLQVVHERLGEHQARAVPDVVALERAAGDVIDIQLRAGPPLREVVGHEQHQVAGLVEALGVQVVRGRVAVHVGSAAGHVVRTVAIAVQLFADGEVRLEPGQEVVGIGAAVPAGVVLGRRRRDAGASGRAGAPQEAGRRHVLEFVGDHFPAHDVDGAEAAALRDARKARIGDRDGGLAFDVADDLHLQTQLDVLFILEGEEFHRGFLHGGGLPDGELLTRLGEVADQQVVLLVGGDGPGRDGAADLDFAAVGAHDLVVVARRGAVAHIDDEVGIDHAHRHVRHGLVSRKSHPGGRIQVEQRLGAGGIHAVVDLFGDVLDHQVVGLGHTVIGRHGEGEAFVVVVRLARVRGDGRMGRQGDGRLGHGQVLGGDQRHLTGGLVHHAAQLRLLEREGNDFALVGLHPLAGDDDAVALTGGVGIGEMILFRQVQDGQGRVDLAVGLQGRADPDLHHIGRGDVVGRFGEIPRNGDFIPVHSGIGDLQPAHFLPFERTEGEIRREGRDPLPVGRGFHEFRLVAGRRQDGRRYHKEKGLLHG